MKIDGYKCPNCSGAVKFDSASQAMKCPYCDTEFELAALEEHQRELGTAAEDGFGWKVESEDDWEKAELEDLAAGSCPSCGAELYGNENTVAEVCPCCGNAQIMVKRLSGTLKPDCVIPFKQDKRAAAGALKEFCRGKRLLPNFFQEENIVGKIQGVYVPFWLFDANAKGRVCYKATKVRFYTTGSHNCTETSHYSVVRGGSLGFEKIPVDASEKMDDEFMDAIEPFDYKQMKEFHQSFLAGYVAEKYDVSAEACKPRAEKRIRATVEDEFRSSVTGYTTVKTESASVTVKEGKVNYGLFPVWILNTKYDNKNYQFMMNGQTGLMAGRLPVDEGKAWGYMAALTFAYGIALSIAAFILYRFDAIALGTGMITGELTGIEIALDPSLPSMIAVSLAISLAIGFLTVRKWKREMDTVRLKTHADGYKVWGSLSFSEKKDTFLYKTVTKVARNSPGGGSGGSGVLGALGGLAGGGGRPSIRIGGGKR